MRKLFLTLLACFSLASFKVSALSPLTLKGARAEGLVCEGNNGLLVPWGASSPKPEVQQLINEVNAERKQKYQEIQQDKPSINLPIVMQIATQNIRDSVPPGTYIMGADGQCYRKPPKK